jgi:hypothetical protein
MSGIIADNIGLNSGSIVAATVSGGKINQIEQATYTTAETTTSSTYTASGGLSDSITPSLTSSKVLITMSLCCGDAVQLALSAIYRDIGGAGYSAVSSDWRSFETNVTPFGTMSYIMFLDSPNTTSACTYKHYFKASSGTAGFQKNSGTSTITLMEILA